MKKSNSWPLIHLDDGNDKTEESFAVIMCTSPKSEESVCSIPTTDFTKLKLEVMELFRRIQFEYLKDRKENSAEKKITVARNKYPKLAILKEYEKIIGKERAVVIREEDADWDEDIGLGCCNSSYWDETFSTHNC